jgi:hypothetical protein
MKISILLFIFLAPISSFAANYYVSLSGSDTYTGLCKDKDPASTCGPWRTPQKGLNSANAGDTVFFRGGDYVVTEYIGSGRSGTAVAPIRYTSYDGEIATIVYDRQIPLTDLTTQRIIGLAGQYTIFDRINVRMTPASLAYTQSLGYAISAVVIAVPNVTVKNCAISGAVLGVYVDYGIANAVVEKCKIFGTYSHAFYITGVNGHYRDNDLDCNAGYKNQRCIQIQYVYSKGNKFYRNLVKSGKAGGVVYSGPVTYNEVFNNIFINAGVHNIGTYGVVVDFYISGGGPPGPGNKFYNNTVIGKRPYSGIIAANYGEQVEVYNNIFSMSESSPVLGNSVYTKIKNNIFYNVTGTIPSGNFTANPMVVNPAGLDAASARIQPGSFATDKSISPAPADDFSRMTRTSIADIGAFEASGGTATAIPSAPTDLKVQ